MGESSESDTTELESKSDENITDNYKQDRINIREQLTTMSFEEIQKLKEKMGSKLYNQTVYGIDKRKAKGNFKRANKNRPREISSKRRMKLENNVIIPIKKQIPRDPRFDPLCGQYDEKIFKSNYKFLNDVRKKDRTTLDKEYKNTTDPERKQEIKYVIQRLDNQIREQQKRDKLNEQKYEEKKDIKDQLKRGEKPTYKKKSEKRIENLIDQYEELKKNNTLQKHIQKRSKKLSSKEKKKGTSML